MHARIQDLNFIHCLNKCWLNVYNIWRPGQKLGIQRLMKLDLCSQLDLSLTQESYKQKYHNY